MTHHIKENSLKGFASCGLRSKSRFLRIMMNERVLVLKKKRGKEGRNVKIQIFAGLEMEALPRNASHFGYL